MAQAATSTAEPGVFACFNVSVRVFPGVDSVQWLDSRQSFEAFAHKFVIRVRDRAVLVGKGEHMHACIYECECMSMSVCAGISPRPTVACELAL